MGKSAYRGRQWSRHSYPACQGPLHARPIQPGAHGPLRATSTFGPADERNAVTAFTLARQLSAIRWSLPVRSTSAPRPSARLALIRARRDPEFIETAVSSEAGPSPMNVLSSTVTSSLLAISTPQFGLPRRSRRLPLTIARSESGRLTRTAPPLMSLPTITASGDSLSSTPNQPVVASPWSILLSRTVILRLRIPSLSSSDALEAIGDAFRAAAWLIVLPSMSVSSAPRPSPQMKIAVPDWPPNVLSRTWVPSRPLTLMTTPPPSNVTPSIVALSASIVTPSAHGSAVGSLTVPPVIQTSGA